MSCGLQSLTKQFHPINVFKCLKLRHSFLLSFQVLVFVNRIKAQDLSIELNTFASFLSHNLRNSESFYSCLVRAIELKPPHSPCSVKEMNKVWQRENSIDNWDPIVEFRLHSKIADQADSVSKESYQVQQLYRSQAYSVARNHPGKPRNSGQE